MPERPWWRKRLKPVTALRARWSNHKREKTKKPEKAPKPRTYRPIHLATLISLLIVACILTGAAASLMWEAAKVPTNVPSSPELAVREAQLRLDVIRNILAIGAGTGGLVALFLALRRQYVKERVDHADQEYKNRTAEDAKHDAAERRITDLYVKAAEQLGSEKATVRLAALYSLERLAQDNPSHRETVMSLICSYLRMPIGEPSGVQALISSNPAFIDYTKDSVILEDLEVRKAAQDLIVKHLWCFFLPDGRAAHDGKYWGDIDLNLRGATLIDWDISSCKAGRINIEGAHFIGDADFSGSFISAVSATGAVFLGNIDFTNVTVDGLANFRLARFDGDADFSKTPFSKLGVFMHARFHRCAIFAGAEENKLIISEALANLNPTKPHEWPQGYRLVATQKPGFGVIQTTEQAMKGEALET
ncbi:pentapeptide repeat protein [Micromonospora pisi]|uniref:Pentapeptide repeat protein n=1 Tax=Micromonospora pisi TaxID=589240 RepID=A0A495JKV8_9ACTN|nr:pentapeptide repeat-containing protein [Micromonospora pisi]RKR89543.1 pentapeptide repeat protein [Micromonospora pisi]